MKNVLIGLNEWHSIAVETFVGQPVKMELNMTEGTELMQVTQKYWFAFHDICSSTTNAL